MIFCVEDDANIRELIIYTLNATGFKTVGFESSEPFLEHIRVERPSLILLDIMLPGMDGLKTLEVLKSRGIDAPVILVTAKSDQIDKIKGLDSGADDYITKPFNTNLLISRCNNLVNSRRILQEKFSKQPQAPARILATNPMDEDLLERTMEIIERNMDNSEFSLSELIRELCMSRTYFFQKIKGITGQTPNEFLSTVRLKRAAFLLRSDLTLSISEISDKTGFSSPRYFGRCFKEAYGVSPLGYRNKGKEDEEQVEKDEE